MGTLEVVLEPDGGYHLLNHGTTIHGAQSLNPARRLEPLTSTTPPARSGRFLRPSTKNQTRMCGRHRPWDRETLACFAHPGQHWVFYKIDPIVVRIAHDPLYFTFLDDCAAEVDVILGDGRLSLARAPDRHFDLIALNVFSSESIPVHFLTLEALRLYLAKLSDGGILLFHISNKFLRLKTRPGRPGREERVWPVLCGMIIIGIRP